jgi:hypothetical protein
MDRTGTLYKQQLAAKKAREAASEIDIEAIRRAEYQRGNEAGRSEGWQSAIDAIVGMYESDGIKAIQELMDELTAPGDDSEGDE